MAQNLESWRITKTPKAAVKTGAVVAALAAMLCAVVVNMVQAEKDQLGRSATPAECSAIGDECGYFRTAVAIARSLAAHVAQRPIAAGGLAIHAQPGRSSFLTQSGMSINAQLTHSLAICKGAFALCANLSIATSHVGSHGSAEAIVDYLVFRSQPKRFALAPECDAKALQQSGKRCSSYNAERLSNRPGAFSGVVSRDRFGPLRIR